MPKRISDSVSQPPSMPPRPQCRPAQPRAHALCVWTVLLVFFAAIGYLGQLAYTRNAGQAQPDSGTGGHVLFGLLLVGFAIAVVIGVIARNNSHHR